MTDYKKALDALESVTLKLHAALLWRGVANVLEDHPEIGMIFIDWRDVNAEDAASGALRKLDVSAMLDE